VNTCSSWRLAGPIAGLITCAFVGGCQALAITAAGVGGATAVSHTLTGITYRTFSEPLPRVKSASVRALNRMGLKHSSGQKTDYVETINAKANDRDIEIQFESLTPNTTRMRVTARSGGLLYDSATATEIILQTEKALGS
jgi:hypothetical protein